MSPEQIRALRKHLGEAQTKFGARFKVTGLTVYRWESGKSAPDDKTLPKIIKLLEKMK